MKRLREVKTKSQWLIPILLIALVSSYCSDGLGPGDRASSTLASRNSVSVEIVTPNLFFPALHEYKEVRAVARDAMGNEKSGTIGWTSTDSEVVRVPSRCGGERGFEFPCARSLREGQVDLIATYREGSVTVFDTIQARVHRVDRIKLARNQRSIHTFTKPGAHLKIEVEVLDTRRRVIEEAPVSWESTNLNVAVVDSAGVVDVIGYGESLIIGRLGPAQIIVMIHVIPPVSKIRIVPDSMTLSNIGDTGQLTLLGTPRFGGEDVYLEGSWSSANDSVVTVHPWLGRVTAVGAGETHIIAAYSEEDDEGTTTASFVDSAYVQVRQVGSIRIEPRDIEFSRIGQTATLRAQGYGLSGEKLSDVAVDWSSSDTTRATVNAAGMVTAKGYGRAKIHAVTGLVRDSVSVSVGRRSATIEPAYAVLRYPVMPHRFSVQKYDRDGSLLPPPAEVEWSVADTSIAQVDPLLNVIRGRRKGNTTLFAKFEGRTISTQIEVQDPERDAMMELWNVMCASGCPDLGGWGTDQLLYEYPGWEGVYVYLSEDFVRISPAPEDSTRTLSFDLEDAVAMTEHVIGDPIILEDAWYQLDLDSLSAANVGRINAVDLPQERLEGRVPDNFYNAISTVSTINWQGNDLSGILDGLSSLELAFILFLDGNEFSGQFPDISSRRLFSLALASNNLTGEVGDFSIAREISILSMNGNELTGELPDLLDYLGIIFADWSDNNGLCWTVDADDFDRWTGDPSSVARNVNGQLCNVPLSHPGLTPVTLEETPYFDALGDTIEFSFGLLDQNGARLEMQFEEVTVTDPFFGTTTASGVIFDREDPRPGYDDLVRDTLYMFAGAFDLAEPTHPPLNELIPSSVSVEITDDYKGRIVSNRHGRTSVTIGLMENPNAFAYVQPAVTWSDTTYEVTGTDSTRTVIPREVSIALPANVTVEVDQKIVSVDLEDETLRQNSFGSWTFQAYDRNNHVARLPVGSTVESQDTTLVRAMRNGILQARTLPSGMTSAEVKLIGLTPDGTRDSAFVSVTSGMASATAPVIDSIRGSVFAVGDSVVLRGTRLDSIKQVFVDGYELLSVCVDEFAGERIEYPPPCEPGDDEIRAFSTYADSLTFTLPADLGICTADRSVGITVQNGIEGDAIPANIVSFGAPVSALDVGERYSLNSADETFGFGPSSQVAIDPNFPAIQFPAQPACLKLPAGDGEDYLVIFQAGVDESHMGLDSIARSDLGHFRVDVEVSADDGLAFSSAPTPPPSMSRPIEDEYDQLVREHRAAERQLRRMEAETLRNLWSDGTPLASAKAVPPVIDSVGQIVPINYNIGDCSTDDMFDTVVRTIRDNVVILTGVGDDPGFTDAEIRFFADQLDDQIYNNLVAYFGDFPDVNGDEKVVVVLTDKVGRSLRGLLGWVSVLNQLPKSVCAASNEMELFFGRTPDDFMTVRLSRWVMPVTMAHELTHVIQLRPTTDHRQSVESAVDSRLETWAAEGQAVLSEEIMGHIVLGNSPNQNYGWPTVENRVGNNARWYRSMVAEIEDYLLDRRYDFQSPESGPGPCSWWHSTSDPCQTRLWYGVAWSFLRFVTDQLPTTINDTTFHQKIIDNSPTDYTWETVAAEFPDKTLNDLLTEWSAMLSLDDNPDLNFEGIGGFDSPYSMKSWNFHSIFDGLNVGVVRSSIPQLSRSLGQRLVTPGSAFQFIIENSGMYENRSILFLIDYDDLPREQLNRPTAFQISVIRIR